MLPPTGGQGWIAELKLNYHWNLVIDKEITVLGRVERYNQTEPMIKADLLIKEECLRFPRVLRWKESKKQARLKWFDQKWIGKNRLELLISATLNFDLFSPDISGIEKYRTIPWKSRVNGGFDKDHCLDLPQAAKISY